VAPYGIDTFSDPQAPKAAAQGGARGGPRAAAASTPGGAPAAGTAGGAPASGAGGAPRQQFHCNGAAEGPRPQDAFAFAVDNSDAPFRPRADHWPGFQARPAAPFVVLAGRASSLAALQGFLEAGAAAPVARLRGLQRGAVGSCAQTAAPSSSEGGCC